MDFRENKKRAKSAKNLIIISLIISLAHAFFDYLNFTTATTIFLILAFIVSIGCAITFIQWFRRAYFNVQLYKNEKFNFTNGWAAGSWFLPFANWVIPIMIMTKIWKVALTKIDIRTTDDIKKIESCSKLIPFWWITYLLPQIGIIVLMIITFINVFNTNSLTSINNYSSLIFDRISLITHVISGIIIIRIISVYSELVEPNLSSSENNEFDNFGRQQTESDFE